MCIALQGGSLLGVGPGLDHIPEMKTVKSSNSKTKRAIYSRRMNKKGNAAMDPLTYSQYASVQVDFAIKNSSRA
jgi:hypothetical protein